MAATLAVMAGVLGAQPAEPGVAAIDTGAFGGIITGMVATTLFDCYYRIEAPAYPGFLAGNPQVVFGPRSENLKRDMEEHLRGGGVAAPPPKAPELTAPAAPTTAEARRTPGVREVVPVGGWIQLIFGLTASADAAALREPAAHAA